METSLAEARKGCLRMSCPLSRSSGFFLMRLSMKEMAVGDTLVGYYIFYT